MKCLSIRLNPSLKYVLVVYHNNVRLLIIQISPCNHLAFPIFLRQVPCSEEFCPYLSPIQIIRYAHFYGLDLALNGPLNTKSTCFGNDFHVHSR